MIRFTATARKEPGRHPGADPLYGERKRRTRVRFGEGHWPCNSAESTISRRSRRTRRAMSPSTRVSRHAPGQEDREPGRRLRLPPLLCRRPCLSRDGSHLLRLAGEPRAPRHPFDRSHRAPGRGRRHPSLVGEATEGQFRADLRSHGARRPADDRLRGSRGPAAGAGRRWRLGNGATRGPGAPCRPSIRSAVSVRSP